MVEYSEHDYYPIEDVSHEINILGVKLSFLPYVAWGFLVGMTVLGPIAAFALLVMGIVICRYLYHAEERGEPMQFSPKFQEWIEHLPWPIHQLIRIPLGQIDLGREEYRE